jgi:DNA-binding transcriptional ArsR family regulator
MRFEPARPDRIDAGIDDLLAFLESVVPDDFQEMAVNAVERVHRDLGTGLRAPDLADTASWRMFLQAGLTTASIDDAMELVTDAGELKRRTIALIQGIWEVAYRDEFANRLPALQEAAALAERMAGRSFGTAFADLTGNRVPSTLAAAWNDVESVTFCPSYHLRSFVSYVLYKPVLVVFFGAPELIERSRPLAFDFEGQPPVDAVEALRKQGGKITNEQMLDGLRALGDANRLRIVDLLAGGELYAQEIVGRLGIAQSAVSRHLALLERAGLVKVRPRGGMKYYAVDCDRLDGLAGALCSRARGSVS